MQAHRLSYSVQRIARLYGKVVSQPMGNIINPAKFPTAPNLEYQGGKK